MMGAHASCSAALAGPGQPSRTAAAQQTALPPDTAALIVDLASQMDEAVELDRSLRVFIKPMASCNRKLKPDLDDKRLTESTSREEALSSFDRLHDEVNGQLAALLAKLADVMNHLSQELLTLSRSLHSRETCLTLRTGEKLQKRCYEPRAPKTYPTSQLYSLVVDKMFLDFINRDGCKGPLPVFL